jgi:hypothetical protein
MYQGVKFKFQYPSSRRLDEVQSRCGCGRKKTNPNHPDKFKIFVGYTF